MGATLAGLEHKVPALLKPLLVWRLKNQRDVGSSTIDIPSSRDLATSTELGTASLGGIFLMLFALGVDHFPLIAQEQPERTECLCFIYRCWLSKA